MTLEAQRYARISEILGVARELQGNELEAYLRSACGSDLTLRDEVLELLEVGREELGEGAFDEGSLARNREALEEAIEGAPASWLPERIGDYEIVRLIGQGGMGVVYEARQQSPRRSVAIKLLHPMHATPDRLRRFRRESELLGRLQHPGIAQIFEAGTYEAGRGMQPFFAMELVEGVDIRKHCEQHELDRCQRIELLARVADAVQYAHERSVIHRDLKPDNVLVSSDGLPRVLDFGIARASSQSATLSTIVTEEGQLVGTLAYMAPEQLSQATDAVTPQIDVYALGVLAFELLVGRLPHALEDLSISQTIALLATTEAPRASTLNAELRGDVETILGKALESDPQRRYASASALAGDLRRYLGPGRSTPAPRAASISRASSAAATGAWSQALWPRYSPW